MTENGEYQRVKERVDELMRGRPFDDGIGPFKAAYEINAEFGTKYSGEEIHAIWTQGKPWTRDIPHWDCCGNVFHNGHGELCPRPRKS